MFRQEIPADSSFLTWKSQLGGYCFLLAFALLFMSSSLTYADKGSGSFPVAVEFKAVDSLVAGEPVRLELTIFPRRNNRINNFSVRFEGWGGLNFAENVPWNEKLDGRSSLSHTITVLLPTGDTSGLFFHIDFGTGDNTFVRSFIPKPNSFVMIESDARKLAAFERENAEALLPPHPSDVPRNWKSAVGGTQSSSPPKYISSCEIDLNADGIPDLAFLIESSRGRELIVLLKSSRSYQEQLVSDSIPSNMFLRCNSGWTLVQKVGKDEFLPIDIPGVYIELYQPEGASVGYYWNGNEFKEIWLSD